MILPKMTSFLKILILALPLMAPIQLMANTQLPPKIVQYQNDNGADTQIGGDMVAASGSISRPTMLRIIKLGIAPPNQLPTVNVGADRTIKQNRTISIRAQAQDSDGRIVRYRWQEGNRNIGRRATLNYSSNTIGVHTITAKVWDDKGGQVQDSLTITVTDGIPPLITINGSATINLDRGLTYHEPGASVTDNVDHNLRVTIDNHLVNTSKVGSYRVTYNAVDSAGNRAVEKTRMVVVQSGGSVNPEGMAIIQGATLNTTMIRIGQGSAITVKKGATLILKAETDKNNSYYIKWYDHLGNPTTHTISSTVTQKMKTIGIFETRNLAPGNYVYTCVVSDNSVTPKKNYKNSITVTILENRHLHPFAANGPLVHTSWGQTFPYNGMTPLANGKHTAVGCVATAMGQIMRTYKWPASGTGSVYDKGSVPNPHAPVKIDLSSYTYNWRNMPLKPTAKNDDIARLLYHAGLAANMKYDLYYSSAKHMQAYAILRNHFGYAVHDNLRMISYNHQSKAALYSMVKRSIDANIVLWVGSNSHSYILDGYSGHPDDNNLKYHLNLGWGYGGEWCPVTDEGVLSYSGTFYGLISFAQIRPKKAGIDTRPPTIRLLGKPIVTHLTCMPYNDAGAVAHDAEDGNLQVEVIGADNLNNGDTNIYYVASDSAGNVTYTKRRILVTDHRKTKKVRQRIRVGRSMVYTSFGLFYIPATKIKSTVWRMNGKVVSTSWVHKFHAIRIGTFVLTMEATLKTGEKLSAEITYIVY